MEISGKILREVEFRDRLRGYDTDEVDEFLEKVAVGIDDMRAELASLRDQLSSADRRVDDTPAFDDEGIRRTLVLAQRTADLAISEAREEASRMVEEARVHAESLVTQAQDAARRLRDEAEFEAHERVDRLAEQRDRLERDIQSLAQLVGTERDRLTQALQAALGFVTESLSVSDELSRAASNVGAPREQVQMPRSEPVGAPVVEQPSVDVESQIREDAATALDPPPQRPGEFDQQVRDAQAELDPDEALWARWAQGVDVDLSAGTHGDDEIGESTARQFPFQRGGPSA